MKKVHSPFTWICWQFCALAIFVLVICAQEFRKMHLRPAARGRVTSFQLVHFQPIFHQVVFPCVWADGIWGIESCRRIYRISVSLFCEDVGSITTRNRFLTMLTTNLILESWTFLNIMTYKFNNIQFLFF